MSPRDRGDRGALVALGLLLIAVVLTATIASWSGEPPDQDVGQSHAREVQQSQGNDISQPVAGQGAFDPWADSYAQWIMAVFGVIATIISVVAVLLLKRNLDAARAAVTQAEEGTRAAKTGADAAREANKITRETYMAERRPWLRWEIKQPISIIRRGDSLRVDISAVLENFGKTPARNVFCFGEIYRPPPDEAAVNRGLRFHAEHLREYQSAMFPFYDILPNEKTPMAFGLTLRIDDLFNEPQKQITLYLSFHAAYRFSEGSGIGEIGAIYMLMGHDPQKLTFHIEDLGSLSAFLMEMPNCRRIN